MDTQPAPQPPEISTTQTQPVDETNRRNGKVARLPHDTREKINTMILDGVPYPDIIRQLSPETAHLNEQNLTNWKDGGYLEWLREFYIIKAIQAKHELAKAIVDRAGDDNASGHAVVESIAVNLCEFLVQTDPTILREDLLSDANKFTKFVNSMVRLAEGGIKCQLHKFRAQDRAKDMAKRALTDEPKGISDESLRKAEARLNLL